MYKSIKTLILVVLVSVAMGCEGLLDTHDTEAITPEVAQENIEGIEAILTSVYNRLQSTARYGRDLMLAADALADNTDQHPVTSGRYDGIAVNQQGSHIGFWNTAYLTINEANYVIEGVDQTEGVTEETRNQMLGEALFQRGLTYFDLAKTYGYEPNREVDSWTQSAIIRTEATRDVEDADLRGRSSNVDVYDQARQDLEDALELLADDDRGVYFANYAAANALLARLHLYLEDWEEAIDYADEAIAASGLELLDSESDFESNPFAQTPNPESILELSIDPVEESLGSNDGLCPYTNPTHWFDVTLSENLIDLFDEDDYRNYLYDYADDGYAFTEKWNCSEGPFDDNIPLVRLPEMFLVKAEAYYELDDENNAVAELEALRTARGLDAYGLLDAAPSGDDLIAEILDERRRELHFEGHRFFDLKRRAMTITKQEGANPVSYDDYRILAPIPQSQVDNNPELDNNPGY